MTGAGMLRRGAALSLRPAGLPGAHEYHPPAGLRSTTILLGVALILLLIAQAGHPLTGAAVTIGAAVLLLGLGLPHGALDIFMLREQAARGPADLLGALLLYVACAALTLVLWRIAPVPALALFLVIAVAHFAEDWRGTGSTLLAHAMATALLAAPALTRGSAVRSIFASMAGDPRAGDLADLLLLAAPVACLSGAVALVMLWQRGERNRAVGGGLSLIAMLALPPVVGFALFFCLFHSPLHFRAPDGARVRDGDRRWTALVAALTIAGLAIGAGIYAAATSGGLPARLVSASFLTLSVLTVPHMLVPRLLAAAAARGITLQARWARADRASPLALPASSAGPRRVGTPTADALGKAALDHGAG